MKAATNARAAIRQLRRTAKQLLKGNRIANRGVADVDACAKMSITGRCG